MPVSTFANLPHRGLVPKSYSVTLRGITNRGENTEVPIMTHLHGTTATGATNHKKAFAGVSHSSEGSGATVGYLYPGIRAKGLKRITSPHPMVKDATMASFNYKGEVSASFDP